MSMQLRPATERDIPELRVLIEASARALSVGYYTAAQIDAAVSYVFGVDSQLIRDGTYYVVEAEGRLIAAGGWSRRRTLYGGDQAKESDDAVLDPVTEAARIRAFFVHPDWTRRGLARSIYSACAAAAWVAGFRRFELMSTRPGEPLYAALGFVPVEHVSQLLPGDVEVDFTRMSRQIDESPGAVDGAHTEQSKRGQ
jgi:GNAT superfamily N-acetyltransferase